MLTELVFPDPQGYADLATLVRRAKQADPGAAVRLQASGGVLRAWVGVLPGSGLLADGAAVGVRGIALAAPIAGSTTQPSPTETSTDLDLVCSAAALLDRFARDGVGATSLTLPTVSTYAAWSGALPATGGWASAGEVSAADLIGAATSGIAEIAEGVGPAGTVAGARAVEELRRRVWARPVPARAVEATGSGLDRLAEAGAARGAGVDRLVEPAGMRGAEVDEPARNREAPSAAVDVPAGAAFAAYVLGFLPDERATVRVWRNGRWVRLQTQVGHVVARP
ncbi:MAG: hypothetical protein IPF90_07050 [Actinomycetales bacterium]|nr:hypothetical protein [Candidatus Phosphoribacter baldrii]